MRCVHISKSVCPFDLPLTILGVLRELLPQRTNTYVLELLPSSVGTPCTMTAAAVDSMSKEVKALLKQVQPQKSLWPEWLKVEMRTNHAGEFGAVQIYEGAQYGLLKYEKWRLKFLDSSDPQKLSEVENAKVFVQRHLAQEKEHLTAMTELVDSTSRTKLLGLWSVSAFLLGFNSAALGGPKGIYWTVHAVETFVEKHYTAQTDKIANSNQRELDSTKELLLKFCGDEIHHKEEAAVALYGRIDHPKLRNPSVLASAWTTFVEIGSAGAVALSRYV